MSRGGVVSLILGCVTVCTAVSAGAENSCKGVNITLKGFVGEALDRMIENHLAATDIDYITAPFESHNERNGLWRTEFWGKFMHAAEPLCAYSGNEKLRKIIDRGVESVLASQEKRTGYIGNYPDELRFGKGWDVWGMKYSLMGLIHNYDGTGNTKALEAAKRLLDYVIAEIGPNGRRGRSLATTGHCAGQPSLSILEPVMWLYQRTQEPRYLRFADYVVAQMDDATVGPQLITLREVPVWARNDPKALDRVTWNRENNRLKAYEMMSCYQGLLDYYEVAGRADCLEAAVKSAQSIVADEINLAGGSCSSEHWFHGALHQHEPFIHLQETCVTITWMRLLEKLVKVTGDPKWGDEFERTFFNAYLGAMKPDGSEFAGYTPLSGYRFHGQHHCRMHTDCCNANGPRGFLSFLRACVRIAPDELILDQYASGIVRAKLPDGRTIGLDVYALYPFEDWFDITTRDAGDYKLTLRIPNWCNAPRIVLNGKDVEGVTNGYFTLARTWCQGDSLRVYLPMPVVARVVDHHVAFTRGPILLARDSRYGEGDLAEVVRTQFQDGQTVPGCLFVRSPSDKFKMTVTIPMNLGSHSENPEGLHSSQVRFCDYWSAGSAWSPGNYYRTWFPLERLPWISRKPLAYQLDISRDKVPTMTMLKTVVNTLARLGYTQFQLYTEHTFAYTQHEPVWREASPMTAEEIRELDDYCVQRGIELVPNQNSFGHMEHWLATPGYADLAEMPGGGSRTEKVVVKEPTVLCPTDPRCERLVAGLYDELFPCFRSRLVNVGCDETFELDNTLGTGRSAAAIAEKGWHRVYLDFLLKVQSLCLSRHQRLGVALRPYDEHDGEYR